MSTRFDSSADRFSRTTALPTSTAFTMTCWFNRVGDAGTFEAIMTMNVSSTLLKIGYSTSSTLTTSGNGGTANFGTAYANGNNFFVALVSSGSGATDLTGYAGLGTDTSLQTVSVPSISGTVSDMNFGNNSNTDWINGRMCAPKAWDVALSVAELEAERRTWLPKRLGNLIFFNPFIVDTGCHIDWTGIGTMTRAGSFSSAGLNPQIAWGVRRRRVFKHIPAAGGSTFPPNSLALTGVGR